MVIIPLSGDRTLFIISFMDFNIPEISVNQIKIILVLLCGLVLIFTIIYIGFRQYSQNEMLRIKNVGVQKKVEKAHHDSLGVMKNYYQNLQQTINNIKLAELNQKKLETDTNYLLTNIDNENETTNEINGGIGIIDAYSPAILTDMKIKEQKIKRIEEKKQKLIQQKKLREMEMKKNTIKTLMKLFDLYYSGVPDKYDLLGNKIKGIAPDPKMAIYYLEKAIGHGYTSGKLKLAHVYHYGMYNQDPNYKKAENIYQEILDNPDLYTQEQLGDAYDKLQELRKEASRNVILKWLNLPIPNPREKNQHHQKYHNIFDRPPTPLENDRRELRPGMLGIDGGNIMRGGNQHPYANDIQNFQIRYGGEVGTGRNRDGYMVGRREREKQKRIEKQQDRQRLRQIERERNRPFNRILDDVVAVDIPLDNVQNRSNVHDHSLITTIRQSLDKIKCSDIGNREGAENNVVFLRNLREFLANKPQNDKTKDAMQALDTIERNHTKLSALNMTETDSLRMVWNRIHDNVNEKNQKDLKNNLYNELAEMVEHGKTVCATGRFARMVDTLNAVDPEVSMKSQSVVNEEMMNKSAKIRDDIISQLSETDRLTYEAVTETPRQKELEAKVKEELQNTLKKDYVDSDILTENKFNDMVGKWIDHI